MTGSNLTLRREAEIGDDQAGAVGGSAPASSSAPLELADRYGIWVHPGIGTDGMDMVEVQVPAGRGWLLAKWLERKFTQTPEAREATRAEDDLAGLLAAVAASKQQSQREVSGA